MGMCASPENPSLRPEKPTLAHTLVLFVQLAHPKIKLEMPVASSLCLEVQLLGQVALGRRMLLTCQMMTIFEQLMLPVPCVSASLLPGHHRDVVMLVILRSPQAGVSMHTVNQDIQ